MADQETGPVWLVQVMALLYAWVRIRRKRRYLMFYLCLGVLALVAAGVFLIPGWLEDHPLAFLGYWSFTILAVVLMMLVALYDMLRVMRGED